MRCGQHLWNNVNIEIATIGNTTHEYVFKSIWSKSQSIHQHGQTAQYFSLSGRINYREKRPGTRREIYERRPCRSHRNRIQEQRTRLLDGL